MDPDRQKIDELYRLTRDNNRMLHSMRRNAFWGGLIKFALYAVLLLGPVWFYYAYLSDTVNSMMQTMGEIQGTGAKAQAQLGSWQDTWNNFKESLSGSN